MSEKRTIGCEETLGCLADYSVGLMDRKSAASVEQHLQVCISCSRELKLMGAAVALVESMEEAEPPAGMWDAVYERIASPEPAAEVSFVDTLRTLFAPPTRALAAGFAILVLMVVMTFGRIHQPAAPAMAEAGTSEYVQGHAIFASQDAFADRVGLASVTGAAMVNDSQQVQ